METQSTFELKQDIIGKIRNIKLGTKDYLFPLYELVINSIQAIHEAEEKNGLINIIIIRNNNELDLIEPCKRNIESFEINDNGIGFNEANFNSFCISDSPYKLSLGCKGVGRFVALKAFEGLEIESHYYDENSFFTRKFSLSHSQGLVSSKPFLSISKIRSTRTLLKNYLPDFQRSSKAETVARKILDHALIYFINNNAPVITIQDPSCDTTLDLNSIYSSYIEQDEVIDNFNIKNRNFELYYIKKYTDTGKHQIHYCANNREVIKKPAYKIVPGLTKPLKDARGNYYLSIYIKSNFLDEKVYSERNAFNIPDNDIKKTLYDIISFEEIEIEIEAKIRENYLYELEAISKEVRKQASDFIYNGDGLEYRHLLHHEDLITTIPPGLNDEKLELALHKLNHRLEKKQKARVNDFLANRNYIENTEKYREELEYIVAQEQELSQSRLTKYISQRKIIIKVLDKIIGKQDNGSYVYEENIHNIIFPRFKDSTTITYKEHNLWILDERLTYHHYISSDNPTRSFTDGDGDKEPDLILFDKKFAFAESDYTSVVIFEFKRPMRSLSGKDKAVHNQVIGYIQELMESKAIDANGRYNEIDEFTPKFGFIICDYDKDMENHLIKMHDFSKTPKNTLLHYRRGINLMLEVINYKTLVKDLETRHKAFFKELGIDKF